MKKTISVLIIGSGAREHCLAHKIRQSPLAGKIYCAPGNGGTAEIAVNIGIKANDIKGLLGFAVSRQIGLTVVGPEVSLAEGISDEFGRKGLLVFGPGRELARLESSKVFAKKLMQKFNIPTAGFEVFTLPQEAKDYIDSRQSPMVIKADGLAAGKGVFVCRSKKEAKQAVEALMVEKRFQSAGEKIIIEDCLEGEELSLMVLTDGENFFPLASSQDHKRAFDNDLGPNTGGMGAYSPVSLLEGKGLNRVARTVFKPLLDGLRKEGKMYRGVLYAGLMVKNDKIFVLEFNVRFGDPEAQVVLPKIKGDFLQIILKAAGGRLENVKAGGDNRRYIGVVLASGGYPGQYQKGKEIKGLEEAKKIPNVLIYQAGTKNVDGKILTDGGRVLTVVGGGDTLEEAKEKAYRAAAKVNFESMQYRKDIGDKEIKRNSFKGEGNEKNSGCLRK